MRVRLFRFVIFKRMLTAEVPLTVRIAVEIGLNCNPPIVQIRNEQDRPRAIRNAERVWMTCFIADRRYISIVV